METVDSSKPEPKPSKRRLRRWMFGFCGGLIVLLLGLMIALPIAANSRSGRTLLLRKANEVLAPARFDFQRIRFSWFAPTAIENFRLISKEGMTVVEAEHAVWDRTLWQILLDRKTLGTLELPRCKLDLERKANGEINLEEVLHPLLKNDPELLLNVEIVAGRVHLKTDRLNAPIAAELPKLSLRLGPAPAPTTWQFAASDRPSRVVFVEGSFDPWDQKNSRPGNVDLVVRSNRWAWSLGDPERFAVKGSVEAEVKARRRSGLWTVEGMTRLDAIEAAGKAPQEFQGKLDRLAVDWLAEQTADGWNVSKLDLDSPLGSIEAKGAAANDRLKELDAVARLDLGALRKTFAMLLPTAVDDRLDGAIFNIDISSTNTADGLSIQSNGRLERSKEKGGAESLEGYRLSCRNISSTDPKHWTMSGLVLETPVGKIQMSGRGVRGESWNDWELESNGTIELDAAELNRRLREISPPDSELSGKFAPFRIKLKTGSEWLSSFSGEIGFDVEHAAFQGFKIGPTHLGLALENGSFQLKPIDSVVNEGRVHLEPKIDRDSTTGALAIRFGKESSAEGIVVNDEVSSRFLAYAAPILESATKVSGKVSANIVEAVIPLDGDTGENTRKNAKVEGSIEFQDLTFQPGPFAIGLLGFAGEPEQLSLKLNQPVSLRIADRRVYQKGLAIPLGRVSEVAIEGSVDFDKNLNLVATVPLRGAMLANRPILGDIIEGTKVEVPVKGTLDHPEFDSAGFRDAAKNLGKTLLGKTVVRGATELLLRSLAPKKPAGTATGEDDADVPASRPSREERRADRLRKKTERLDRNPKRP